MRKETYFKDFVFYASLNVLGMISLSLSIQRKSKVREGLGEPG